MNRAQLLKITNRVTIKINPRLEKLPLKSLFISTFVINGLVIAVSLLSRYILPPEIPLFYGLPKNESQLASSIYIILPSVVSIIITAINLTISLLTDNQYFKKVFAIASVSITALGVIATLKIIFLVGTI